MFQYRNEAAFSKAVVTHLRKKGWFVQRIESGETGKGIPDIYAVSADGYAMWIELKREHCVASPGNLPVYIHWRPGQQAWLHEMYKRKQHVCTLACFDDVILHIPHVQVYKNNLVIPDLVIVYKSLQQL